MTLNASDILPLFGTAASSESMQTLWSALNTLQRPVRPDPDEGFHDWVLARRKGVELGFADDEYHNGAAAFRWGTGELILTQVYFYAGFDDVQTFAGELPCGLAFADDRARVQEKMAPFAASRHSHLSDTWDLDAGIRLNVVYADGEARIDRMACLLLPTPLLPTATAAPPDLAVLPAHFGDAFTRQAVAALWPQGWDDDTLADAAEDGVLDLGQSYGASIVYAGQPGSRLLRTITLHGNRDVDAATWPGELPSGLQFDDSAQTLFAKMVDPPAQQADSALTGYAVWHLPDYTLQVLYSNLYNRLLRVSLIAPGTWLSATDLDGLADAG